MAGEQTQAQEQPKIEEAPKAPETYKPPSREEWDKVTRALADRNKEAADNRKAAEVAHATADAAAKAKLESEGKWKEAFELERARRGDDCARQTRFLLA